MNIRSIITHGGNSHRDDLYAVVAVLGRLRRVVPVYRREPTADEMADKTVVKLDVGKQLNADLMQFDHHQDKGLPAAYVLACWQLLKWDLAIARGVFPWFDIYSDIDAQGPFKTGAAHGIPSKEIYAMMSPLDDAVLDMFAWDYGTKPRSGRVEVRPELVEFLLQAGLVWVSDYEFGKERLEVLDRRAERIDSVSEKGTRVPGFYVPEDLDRPTYLTEVYREKNQALCLQGDTYGFCISRNERDPGWSLYRYDDDARLDFTRLNSLPAEKKGQVLFCTPFIAKIKPMCLNEAREFVKAAVVDPA